ncbi:MAG: winged helix-turn-helix domain-containing protein [Elusimicrobiota bacterium]|jgi:hypothetical protein|nr:winged helix-turn-helix domain-containing protein [Elusimicrobiota bacterium]
MSDDIKTAIGLASGEIWNYLSKNGDSSFVEIKSDLELSNTMFCLALGWLAREDKIYIKEFEHNNYIISLK